MVNHIRGKQGKSLDRIYKTKIEDMKISMLDTMLFKIHDGAVFEKQYDDYHRLFWES